LRVLGQIKSDGAAVYDRRLRRICRFCALLAGGETFLRFVNKMQEINGE
jgi:hypothetical protein